MTLRLAAPGAALIEAASGRRLGGPELGREIEEHARGLQGLPEGVVFARTGISLGAALRYLGCLSVGRPVALLDPELDPSTLAEMVHRFAPAAVVGLEEGMSELGQAQCPSDYEVRQLGVLGQGFVRLSPDGYRPHPDLGLLLATSGSTGSAKLVRLSWEAVRANAASIADALHIGPDDIAPTSLPLFYSYGLSVFNSHLVSGATVLLVDGGVLAQTFWQAFDHFGATSLAGVPYNYEMLHRIRWTPAKHPSLKSLTQAGGRLRTELIEAFHQKIDEHGGRFQPMYGQTEATARIAVLPADRLPAKLGSPGRAIPGGRLTIRTDDGVETREAGVSGEVIYHGPNVMMGYADTAADLSRGDDLGGALRTGDIGYLDDEGYLFLTGRIKRIGKVFGVRVNLDDIEKIIVKSGIHQGPVAAVPAADKVVVWCEGEPDDARRSELVKLLSERMNLHRTGFDVRAIDRLPQLSSGKVDYRTLGAMV